MGRGGCQVMLRLQAKRVVRIVAWLNRSRHWQSKRRVRMLMHGRHWRIANGRLIRHRGRRCLMRGGGTRALVYDGHWRVRVMVVLQLGLGLGLGLGLVHVGRLVVQTQLRIDCAAGRCGRQQSGRRSGQWH